MRPHENVGVVHQEARVRRRDHGRLLRLPGNAVGAGVGGGPGVHIRGEVRAEGPAEEHHPPEDEDAGVGEEGAGAAERERQQQLHQRLHHPPVQRGGRRGVRLQTQRAGTHSAGLKLLS